MQHGAQSQLIRWVKSRAQHALRLLLLLLLLLFQLTSNSQVLHASSLHLLRLLIVSCDTSSLFNARAADILAGFTNLLLRDLVTQRTGLHFLDGDASL